MCRSGQGALVKVLRAILYHIGAGLFEQPSPEQTDALRALVASLLDTAPEGAPWLPALAGIAQDLGHEEQLQEEYARLFVVGVDRVPAAPYASSWLPADAPLSVADARSMMVEHGLEQGAYPERNPEHIISELEFAALLIERGSGSREIQHRFLHEHLFYWIPRFTAALRGARPVARYIYAATFLDQLLLWEGEYLQRRA